MTDTTRTVIQYRGMARSERDLAQEHLQAATSPGSAASATGQTSTGRADLEAEAARATRRANQWDAMADQAEEARSAFRTGGRQAAS